MPFTASVPSAPLVVLPSLVVLRADVQPRRSGRLVSLDICKIIFAIILPPLGVFLERGCGADLLINICLTILGWIPGIIHAIYIIFKY
ncbi:hypothetical protein N7535_001103 [Penicillium sp. DV-2018c]|nr:hypothetical protein N7535_001103 [Penicillium sp. DV-2018c]